jgi:sorbose reductase
LYGTIRRLIAVGVAVGKAAVDMTKEDYDSQMNPNVWGCFTVAQAAVK